MPVKKRLLHWTMAAACAVGSVAGCYRPPRPVPPLVPQGSARVRVDHFAGSTLSGPLVRNAIDASADDGIAADVTLIAVERMDPSAFESLGAKARLILSMRGAAPVRPAARLTRSAGYASGQAVDKVKAAIASGKLGRSSSLGHFKTAICAGTTAVAEITDPSGLPDPSSLSVTTNVIGNHRRLQFDLGLTGTGAGGDIPIYVSILLEDFIAPEAQPDEPTADAALAGKTPLLQQEVVLLDSLTVKQTFTVIAIFVPFQFCAGTNQGVVAIIRLSHGSSNDAEYGTVLRAAADDVKRSSEAASVREASSPDAATILGARWDFASADAPASPGIFVRLGRGVARRGCGPVG